MLHPVLVVALREVLARVRAAALGAVLCGFHRDDRLGNQIVEFQCLDEIRVPDQRAVRNPDVGDAAVNFVNELLALFQDLGGAKYRAIVLHHLLHFQP